MGEMNWVRERFINEPKCPLDELPILSIYQEVDIDEAKRMFPWTEDLPEGHAPKVSEVVFQPICFEVDPRYGFDRFCIQTPEYPFGDDFMFTEKTTIITVPTTLWYAPGDVLELGRWPKWMRRVPCQARRAVRGVIRRLGYTFGPEIVKVRSVAGLTWLEVERT